MVAQAHGGNQTTIAGHRQRLDRKPLDLAHLPSESMEQRSGLPISNHPDKIAPIRIKGFESKRILLPARPGIGVTDHFQRDHASDLCSRGLYLLRKIAAADHVDLFD